MKAFIVTEGFNKTGYGHLTRCLALYQAFEERVIRPIFIANCDEDGKNYLGNINLKVYNWLEERENFLKQITGSEIIIIDSYLAPKDLYENVSERVNKAVYIDDFLRIEYPQGIIINGTIGAEKFPYIRKPDQRYLLGSDYTPLRKEFCDIPDFKRSNKNKNVLITFGGQDIRNLTFPILDLVLEQFSSLNCHVVLGCYKENKDLSKYKVFNVKLYTSLNAKKMLELMLKCNFAVTAAGQTTYELARVGLQTIAIGIIDNQKYNIKGWIEKGFLKKEIWYYQKDLFEQLTHSIKEILNSRKKEHTTYCDGQGARRIVNTIIDNRINLMTDIVFREATLNDAKIIFDLSNEEDVRSNSINRKPIEWEEHLQWLKSKLDDNKYYIFLFFVGNKFLGQIKFEIELSSAKISISLHSDFRGKGLSSIVLKRAIEYFLWKNNVINSIIALIRPMNESSIKSFSKAGFIYNGNEMINHELFLKYIYYR